MARRFKGKQLNKPLQIDGDLSITGSLIVTGVVTGSFYGDGSGLTNINVSDLTLFQIVSGSTSARVDVGNGDLFIVKKSGIELFKVNNNGVVIYNDRQDTPPFVYGGIMYSSSNFWVGLDD